ncbi:MAG: hypothetical protein AAB870_04720 [Patescibacteria group bacterium]
MAWLKYNKKWIYGLCIGLVLGGFAVLYSYLSWESVHMPLLRFSAPDEQANYVFSKLFAEQSTLSYPEPLLEVSQHFVHTRSMTASHGEVKPVGFLGFSLIYGALAKVFSVSAIPFFTPILSVLTTLFFYAALKRIFNKKIAFLSSVLLLIQPAYWYYSSRALMPNILFLDLLIVGLSLLVIASPTDRKEQYIKRLFPLKIMLFGLSGFFIALSLTVRLSESLWVGTLLFLWGLIYIRRLTVWRVLSFILGFAIPIAVLLFYNYSLYGNILSSGYKLLDADSSTQAITHAVSIVQHGQLGNLFDAMKDVIRPYMPLLLPFGYRPDIFWNNGWNYIVQFFWWFTIPTVAGIVLLLRNQVIHIVNRHVPHQLWYLFVWVGVTFWLLMFYGSWKLTDNINGQITLGVSYVRYWLPSYVMALPFIAMLFVWLFEKGRNSILRRSVVITLLGVMMVMSTQTVLLGGQESLSDNKQQLHNAQGKAQAVFGYTETEAVIFSERSDKLFFPERRVAGSFAEFPEINLIVTLIQNAPVYYYGLWNPETAAYVSSKYFEPSGIRWEYVATVAPREHLYRLVRISQ